MNPNLSRGHGLADSASLATLKVDVIADLACPWCWLGKRRLDDALLAVRGPSQVRWYPLLVNPGLPEDGMTFAEYLEARCGDPEHVEQRLEELTLAGRAEGIDFRFDRLTRMPATVDAHRLLKLAEAEGMRVSTVAETLFRGCFEEGLNLGDREILVDLGRRCGLPPTSIRRTLADTSTRQLVLSQDRQIRKSGLCGVPNFLVNKRLFVIGAQSTEALVNVFDRAMFGEESARPVSSVLH